jgi:uncharacterized NAD(P)/FAD-binding protein YdhS
MKSDRQLPVAIVGGGFSGTIVAAQLAQQGLDCVLIEGGGRLGRGVAYSTREPAHLLNVRAEGMSAWPDEPDHFAKQFAAAGGEPGGFAPRMLFGAYLGEILAEARRSGKVQVEAATVTAAARNQSWRIQLGQGRSLEASALVLASGNQEPAPLAAFAHVGQRLIGNPWGDAAASAVADLALCGGDALIIGTGLTMVDLCLSLDAAGHQGRVVALSRRGLIPRCHAQVSPAPVEVEELPSGNLGALARWLRRRAAEVGWRAAVDSLRPHSHVLWQSLSAEQQRRFLRHARPWWDVHRHRIAPQVADLIARMIAEGRLELLGGRISEVRSPGERLEVAIRRRGASAKRTELFDYAFNCTGPLHSISGTNDPLLRSLLAEGQVRPDHLGIGFEANANSRIGERLWALGPLTKGRYWEIIAVPDIREQAAQVADDIARELSE